MGKFMELPRDHVNAYIIETDEAVVVVDTTLAVSSAKELRAQAEAIGKPIAGVLVTHGHPDHYTGLWAFADVPRYASQGCIDFAKEEDRVKAPVAKSFLGDDYPDERVFPDQVVVDGQSVSLGGVEFTFTDLGPGESDADGMWSFQDDGVTHAFVGDIGALNCHCFFRDGHAHEWLDILDKLEAQFGDDAVLYLGHGESPASTAVLDWQKGYVRAFLHAVDDLVDHPDPASREAQEQVIAAMQTYLPGEATIFLLDYELDVSIPRYVEIARGRRPFAAGQGREFFQRQLELMSTGQIDRLVEEHYASDAVMVTFDGVRRGHAELKQYYWDRLGQLEQVNSLTVTHFVETEDTILFRADLEAVHENVHAQNALFMRNGRIARHLALTILDGFDYEGQGTAWSSVPQPRKEIRLDEPAPTMPTGA